MIRFLLLSAISLLAWGSPAWAGENDARGMEHFEKKIRPVMTEHCYSCHSQKAKKIRGGLLLDSRDGLRKGGDSGPAVVPGHPERSLLIQALRHEKDLAMPPQKKLPPTVVADFVRWVEMGAPDPRGGTMTPRKAFQITEADRKHWSFQTIAEVAPPSINDESWCRSDIDRFILAKLEEKGLRPGPAADKHALLRRASFDLIGLPPTPVEIKDFVKDDSPRAFEKVVDRLLASQEFGVRWGQHWLDGVRYASDVDRSGRYRDWVVRSFNDDLPYFDFVALQIAGDLILPSSTDPARVLASGASLDGITATGMLALAVWEKVGRDLAVAEIVDSQIDVVGRQFLGLTLACARCHDHKFDPVSTQDYYGLAGIFFSSHISPGNLIADGRLSHDVVEIPLLTKANAVQNQVIDVKLKPLQERMAKLESKAGPAGQLWNVRKQLKELKPQVASAKASDRTKLQKQLDELRTLEKKLLEDRQRNGWPESFPELAEIVETQEKIKALKKSRITPPQVIGIQEGGVPGSNRERIGDATIYIRGDHRKEGAVAPRRFPVILAGENQIPLGRQTAGSGRLELSKWITSPRNPLTARVMVNRIWQHLFRDGLVRTPDNFGILGERPTHPELLDYLSRRFIASRGSVKQMIREIMLSNAYQQSSFAAPSLVKADPENRRLGRMNRKRLEYEVMRDSLLFLSGQLTYQRKGEASRRTIFEPILRRGIDPARSMFDGPDPHAIVADRSTTTTAPQALFLMNNALVAQAASKLGEAMQKDGALEGNLARIRNAYLRLFGRPPAPEEVRIGEQYLAGNTWSDYLQMLFCTNEFLYLD